jgi:signal transduction histidine kinase
VSEEDHRFDPVGRWGTAWRMRQALAALGVGAVLGSKLTLPGMGPPWPETIFHAGLFLALAVGLQVAPRLRPYAIQLHGALCAYIGAWSVYVAWTNEFDPMHLTVLLTGLVILGFIYPHARGVAAFHVVMVALMVVAMRSRPPPHWTPASVAGFYALMAIISYAVALVRDRVLQDLRGLSFVAEHVPQGVVMLDREGRVVWSNGAVGRVGPSALPGKPLASLFEGPEGALRVLADALREARPVQQVQLHHRKEGRPGWVSLSLQPVADPMGRVERFVALEDDVTADRAYVNRLLADRAEAQGALERAEGQLRQSQKMEALGRLAGGVAHDINNVLTVILAHATLLQEIDETAEDREQGLGAIVTAAGRAADIAKRLLAFSRHQLLSVRTVDVNAWVRDFSRMVTALVGEHIRVELDLSPAAGTVRADVAQLDQLLLNLVVNARDAMPEGGRLRLETSSAEVPLRGDPAGPPRPHVRIAVADTGVGMDAETREHVFEPFFTTKESGRGTGLGLAIVDGVVRQLGGFVEVDSAPGAGTTFRVFLPASLEAVAAEGDGQVTRLEGTERVLLVEDDAAVRAVAARILRHHGYTVVDVPDAEQAVLTAEHEPFDALLTDVRLPGTSGPELARRLRAAHPRLRVLFLSGYALEAPPVPDARFLAKPFGSESLLRCVRHLLD